MSVIIKGMEMPKTCKECPFSDHEAWCLIPGDWRERYYCPEDERSEHCSLIELPSHGRLIEADYLKEHLYQCEINGRPLHRMFTEIDDLFDVIDKVPTIIEAEDEE